MPRVHAAAAWGEDRWSGVERRWRREAEKPVEVALRPGPVGDSVSEKWCEDFGRMPVVFLDMLGFNQENHAVTMVEYKPQ